MIPTSRLLRIGLAALTLAPFLTLVTPTYAASDAKPAKKEKSSDWISLFDGKTLNGWRVSTENPDTFKVQDGLLVAAGPRAHLFYDGPVQNHDFKNFELKLEIKTFPKANSGVYFHTVWQDKNWPAKGYEIQVNNSHKDPKRTAGIYGIKDNFEAPVQDGEWFTMRIKVQGKSIETFVNDRPISAYVEEDNVVRPPSFAGRLIDHGTFAIQGHDPESKVLYRSIQVRILP